MNFTLWIFNEENLIQLNCFQLKKVVLSLCIIEEKKWSHYLNNFGANLKAKKKGGVYRDFRKEH